MVIFLLPIAGSQHVKQMVVFKMSLSYICDISMTVDLLLNRF